MGTSAALNEQSIVCRTCLKVLDTTGFTYIDDESGYVKNVGNIREMLQFCIPELDLYVSTQPVICYQCLPILVQVYNFKIKCLNGENIIKAYITRNNLQEYNHVNLNCVLMDDLKLKSQKIHIESRIKHMMLKELPESNETPTELNESIQIMKHVNQASQETMDNSFNIILTDPGSDVNLQDNQQGLVEKGLKFEVEEVDDADIDYDDECEEVDGDVPDVIEDMTNDISKDHEVSNPMQIKIVAVRKDLFENNNQSNKTSTEHQPQPIKDKTTLILNNGRLSQNGRIVIKIDRKKLEKFTSPIAADKESTVTEDSSDKNTPEVTPPPLTPLQISASASSSSEHSYTPQIVTVETVEDTSDKEEETYSCNKCCYVTNDVIKIYDHNRTYHNFDYTCQHCPFSTSKVELLGKHMTMVHPQNMVSNRNLQFKVTENYACSMCPFSVKSIDLLRSHHLSAHGTTDGDKGPIVLNTAFSEDLTRHEPRILKRLEYTCDVCPYTTKDKSNLRKHLFTHGTKPLKCDHCAYKCVSPYQLRRHQKQKHAKQLDPRPRNQPYKLPDLKKEQSDAMDTFKITLETIKRELEKEISA